jgi:hypothetical protein
MVTDVTFADADEARPPDSAWISAANFWPFCSSEIRLAVGVAGLKNASKLALIAAVVADEPPLELAGELLPAGAAGDVAGVDELELLALEQAVIAAASARPSAGASKIRRAV